MAIKIIRDTSPVPEEEEQVCPECGASLKKHRQLLNASLVRMLSQLNRLGPNGQQVVLRENKDQLDYNMRGNFQKLKYWDLVEECEPLRHGIWRVTQRGRDFLAGNLRVFKAVMTYRKKRLFYIEDEGQVTVYDVDPGFRRFEDYAADARGTTRSERED